MVKKWIQEAIKTKGKTHRLSGIPQRKKIPVKLLERKIKQLKQKARKRGGFYKKDLKIYRRLILAKTLKRINKKRKK